MNAKRLPANKPLNLKWVAGGAAVLAVVGVVGWWVFFSKPAPAWRVRAEVVRFLKKQSHKSDFSINFRFPSKQARARAGASDPTLGAGGSSGGNLPKRSFDSLANEYLDLKRQELILEREVGERKARLAQVQGRLTPAATTNATNNAMASERVATLQRELATQEQALAAKQQQLAPLVRDLWTYQRAWLADEQVRDTAETGELARALNELLRTTRPRFEAAQTYAVMYELIGQQLWVAQRLFTSANPEHRRSALGLARQAAWDADRYTENPWLAARIYEGYILPHLELADATNRRAALSLDNLVQECTRIFRMVEEPENILRTYKLVLASAKTPQQKDQARVQLSRAYEQDGDYARALDCLKQVQLTNDFAWALRRIPWLQDRIKSKR